MSLSVDSEDQASRTLQLLEAAAAPGADPALALEARAAVQALFGAHHTRVQRVCRRFLGDRERALDMTQEVFVTAWRRLGEWRGEGAFFSWLYGIARFKCMNAIRRKQDVLAEDGIVEGIELGSGPVTELRRHERLALLQRAADQVLDDLEQEVLHLRYHEGIGQEEITRILGLTSKSGARGVLVRCRRKLQRALREQAEQLQLASSYFAVTR